MTAHIGNGWVISHLAEHCIELKKESYEYRRFTDADGWVRVQGQQGISRSTLIERALQQANRCDAELATRVAARMLPTGKALADYRNQSRAINKANLTGEESSIIGVKGV